MSRLVLQHLISHDALQPRADGVGECIQGTRKPAAVRLRPGCAAAVMSWPSLLPDGQPGLVDSVARRSRSALPSAHWYEMKSTGGFMAVVSRGVQVGSSSS